MHVYQYKRSLRRGHVDAESYSSTPKADVACAFVLIDCHLLPESYRLPDFWKQVLHHIESTFDEPAILTQLDVVRRSDFGSFTLKRLAVPPDIAIQIEDARREIQANEDEMKRLGGRE